MPRAIIGKTDLLTTRPDIASMFEDKDLPYHVSKGSHKKAWFICPNCGNRVYDVIRKVDSRGLRCPVCSDGISYGEKFVSNVLTQLDIDFIHDKQLSWSNRKRYDFYIESMSMIIETHGAQHYSVYGFDKTLEEEQQNDNYKRCLALENGITTYVELDCTVSEFNYVKNSIMDSALNGIFDLSKIDWDSVFDACCNSRMIECCNMWNDGVRSVDKISKHFGYDNGTVRDYLKSCASIGLCDYKPYCHKEVPDNVYKSVICVDTQIVYPSLTAVEEAGFNRTQVSACCNHYPHVNTSGGYNWCFYDEYDPETYVMKPCDERGIPKPVRCIETGKIYAKLVDVKQDGFTPSAVSQVCNGKKEYHKNYHFEFVD